MGIKASSIGLEIIDRARELKGWTKTGVPWQVQAEVSRSTLDRFWRQDEIKHQNFVSICSAVGIDDWQKVADLPPIEAVTRRHNSNFTRVDEPVTLRGSNLTLVNNPVIVELERFAQQIFDWFGALSFEFEGLPRRAGNYAEWVIRVPERRSRFDRVLIRAIIHEAGLSDLDGLRRSVADLRVDEGWLVTSLWVSPAVKQVLSKSEERLICQAFDELIDQDANFTPYVAWLEAEVRRRELEKYYVPLGCTKGEFDGSTKTLRGVSSYRVSEGGIDLYIDRWLENPMNEHVSILGEFGTGKTWFVLHYAGRCLHTYLEAKRKGLPRPRLPLVIPLRDYAKALDVENVLAGFFYTRHNIRLNSAVFDRLNQMGKLLLIFDGFDEMADKVDHQKMIDNFWELAKVVTTNAKVILTCRTEHFPTAQVGRDTLRGELLASTARLTGMPPQFETLELMKFDDEQIKEVLGRRTNEVTVSKVMGNGQVLDLLRRAVMAEFVLAALPEIEAGAEIDLARVYLYAVRRQMEENITTGRTFTSLADKLYFLCELSWEMLSTDRMSLNYREFPDLLRKFFGREVESPKDLDHWHYDMMGQTMLVRNDDGDYSPAHRSLLEFFVAYKFAAELGLLAQDCLEIVQQRSKINSSLPPQFYTWSSYWKRNVNNEDELESIAPLVGFGSESVENLRNTFGKKSLDKAVIDLLFLILTSEITSQLSNFLVNLMKSSKAIKSGYLGGNATTVLVRLKPDALIDQDLSDTNLASADFTNAELRGTNLSDANLENCRIREVVGSTNAIVISNDDQQFITAHNDNSIRIWDRSSGKVVKQFKDDHQSIIDHLSLSEDDQFLYSCGLDYTIKKWDLINEKCVHTFVGDKVFTAIALSRDGQFLYSGNADGMITQWSLANREIISEFTGNSGHTSSVRVITLSMNGQYLYSGSYDRTIKKWRLADGECVHTFKGHQDWVRAIALSNDGNFLYSGGHDNIIIEWKLADGEPVRKFEGHQNWVRTIALTNDGKFLYSGSYDHTIKKWRLADGECINTLSDHQNWVMALALTSDGKFLYSGSDDCIIKEWKLESSTCERTFHGYQNWVMAIVPSRDGKYLYTGGHDHTIKVWDVTNRICKNTFKGDESWLRSIVLSRDEQFIYSGSAYGNIRKWRLADGECVGTFEGHRNWVMTLALSSDGKFLYAGGHDNKIKKWSLADGECISTFEGHQNWIMTITLSEDGYFLYSGSIDGTVKKWNVADSKCIFTIKNDTSGVGTIALSKDGQFLYSGKTNGEIDKWSLVDRKKLRTFEGNQNWVRAIALSGDGRFLYSGGNDSIIKEWNLADGEHRRTFEGHQNWVTSLTMSENDKLLYSGSCDGTAKIWDITTGQCLKTIDTRLCAGANITGAKGLTPAQTDALIALGAVDDNRK